MDSGDEVSATSLFSTEENATDIVQKYCSSDRGKAWLNEVSKIGLCNPHWM